MINTLKMLGATNVQSNHQCDYASQMKHHKKGKGQNNDKYEEKNENVPALDFMMDGRCYCCGKVVHKSQQCQYKDKPNNE